MKTREEILAKAEELRDFERFTVQQETRYMLLDIAGDTEADMLSEDGVHDYLHAQKRWGGTDMSAQAVEIVTEFLHN